MQSLILLFLLVALTSCGGVSSKPVTQPTQAPSQVDGRSLVDQPDRLPNEYQVHIIYAVAKDGVDRRLDINNDIGGSLMASNLFLMNASNGQKIRFDENVNNQVDITYVRLPDVDVDYAQLGLSAREAIQKDLIALGFTKARKLYLVYYDGSNQETCGTAPPLQSGDRFSVLFLGGGQAGKTPCSSNILQAADQTAGYWEWTAAHEVIHSLGAVSSCAPNHSNSVAGHVGDFASDLMYAGDAPWLPTTLDVNQDDYYGASVPAGCPNLFLSAFLEPQQGSMLPTGF